MPNKKKTNINIMFIVLYFEKIIETNRILEYRKGECHNNKITIKVLEEMTNSNQ